MGLRAVQCFLVSFVALSASASAQDRLPTTVREAVAELTQMCTDAGGKHVPSKELLQMVDLTSDGVPDYVLDQGSFNCDGAASLFGGSGGFQMSVYRGMPGGQAVPAFSSGTFGVKVEQETSPAKLSIIVSGELCGQRITPTMSHAEYKACWRPVVWNARTKTFGFAPVSQTKPVQ